MKTSPDLKRLVLASAVAGFFSLLFSGCIVVDHRHRGPPPPPAVRADVIIH